MFLYGELGTQPGEVNGHYFAQELNWLGKNYDDITIRMNCGGGLVNHGSSIFTEMVTSPAKIIIQVDGIAASMGAVLLAAADEVTAVDYARVMLHSPYYIDKDGTAVKSLSKADKKALAYLRDMLVTMLSKRGIEKEAVEKMLTTSDNWLTAEEALEAKIIDRVISTGKKKEMAALHYTQLAASISTLIPKNSDMKQLIAKFALPETSDEAAVLAAVNQLESAHTAAVNKLQDDNKKLVDKLIEGGKASGQITDKNEAHFRELATTNPDLFLNLVNVQASPAEQGRVSDFIAKLAEQAGGKQQPADEKDFDWYQKNDPVALRQMEVSDKPRFDKLLAAYNAKFV